MTHTHTHTHTRIVGTGKHVNVVYHYQHIYFLPRLVTPVAPMSPADTFTTTELNQPVKLRVGRAPPPPGEQDFEPLIVHELFARTVRLLPNAMALGMSNVQY